MESVSRGEPPPARMTSGEKEDGVRGRLLHDFQKRVRTLVGYHVCFVDDEDAIAGFGWRKHGAVAKFSHVVNTVVAGGVELGHVQVAGPVGGKGHT